MTSAMADRPIDILLVEDNPGDVRLAQEALKRAKVAYRLHTVKTGEAAIAFLNKQGDYIAAPRPDIVLLDLNLPQMSGGDVLKLIKTDGDLRAIPVIVLSTSAKPSDVAMSYSEHANCYVRKPAEMSVFRDVMRKINEYWFSTARLPEA